MLLNLGPVRQPTTPTNRTRVTGVQAHRCEVVRRLLAQGLSSEALIRLLPEWHDLIRSVADDAAGRD